MAPPVQPSRGLLGFFGFAPANCDIAETTPARSWLSNEPNAPWQSDSTPTLIGVPEPVRGATAGCAAGQSFDAGWSLPPAFTLAVADGLPLLSLLLSPLLPQPATAGPAKPARTAPTHAPRRNLFIAGIFLLEPSSTAPACAGVILDTKRSELRTAQPAGVRPGDPRSSTASPVSAARRRRGVTARSHNPIAPEGDTSTMTRNTRPITVWNRSPMKPMSCA